VQNNESVGFSKKESPSTTAPTTAAAITNSTYNHLDEDYE